MQIYRRILSDHRTCSTVETLYKFERVIAKPLKSAEIRGILAQYAARKTAA